MSDRRFASEMTMPAARPRRSSPWIALAAFLAATSATDGASACSTTGARHRACAVACGCCEAPSSGGTTTADAGARATTEAVLVHEPAAPLAAEVCGGGPAGGCACRPESPTAPEPKGHRAGESRPDPGRNVAVGIVDWHVAPEPLAATTPATAGPPQKLPIYLRTSRLLN